MPCSSRGVGLRTRGQGKGLPRARQVCVARTVSPCRCRCRRDPSGPRLVCLPARVLRARTPRAQRRVGAQPARPVARHRQRRQRPSVHTRGPVAAPAQSVRARTHKQEQSQENLVRVKRALPDREQRSSRSAWAAARPARGAAARARPDSRGEPQQVSRRRVVLMVTGHVAGHVPCTCHACAAARAAPCVCA